MSNKNLKAWRTELNSLSPFIGVDSHLVEFFWQALNQSSAFELPDVLDQIEPARLEFFKSSKHFLLVVLPKAFEAGKPLEWLQALPLIAELETQPFNLTSSKSRPENEQSLMIRFNNAILSTTESCLLHDDPKVFLWWMNLLPPEIVTTLPKIYRTLKKANETAEALPESDLITHISGQAGLEPLLRELNFNSLTHSLVMTARHTHAKLLYKIQAPPYGPVQRWLKLNRNPHEPVTYQLVRTLLALYAATVTNFDQPGFNATIIASTLQMYAKRLAKGKNWLDSAFLRNHSKDKSQVAIVNFPGSSDLNFSLNDSTALNSFAQFVHLHYDLQAAKKPNLVEQNWMVGEWVDLHTNTKSTFDMHFMELWLAQATDTEGTGAQTALAWIFSNEPLKKSYLNFLADNPTSLVNNCGLKMIAQLCATLPEMWQDWRTATGDNILHILADQVGNFEWWTNDTLTPTRLYTRAVEALPELMHLPNANLETPLTIMHRAANRENNMAIISRHEMHQLNTLISKHLHQSLVYPQSSSASASSSKLKHGNRI